MTPQEIIIKCAAHGISLQVRNGKLAPIGNITPDFLKLSNEFVPYKQEVIAYLVKHVPDSVVVAEGAIAINAAGTPNDKINRLRLPCVHLGPALEKAAGCGCGGAVTHKCAIFEKCRRAGNYRDIAICTECDRYEPSK
jgi:hypothetical protein